ncbi:right-handed parallel beta-helix repeat-containing protein [Poseidonocella sp. HB161398]|uniref:right-handed parallel beta-helix repeat-containing protein n=1 Tax=Poseidonocella sp. HB161398 TaxID=2320855 RepID=UPI00110886DE|nr:right-handed parallel beta-helix repeat-containing protein [Poseidonocella sp. HB161398]
MGQSGTLACVSNAAELEAALSAATGGETIRLAPGDYGTLSIGGRYDGTVTLEAEIPGTVQASGLQIRGAANVALEGIDFQYDYQDGQPDYLTFFKVQSSTGIAIRNCSFTGSDMEGTGTEGDGYPAGRGLSIGTSQQVLLEGNAFSGFWKGIGVGNSADVILRGNEITDIRSDGLNITSSDGVLVEGNHIHDFRGNPATGDHADMIQVYSSADPDLPRNITIRDNLLDIGQGDPAQSIWITHNAAARNAHGADVAFENIEVTGNVIINSRVQGIVLGTTHGATVTGNTVIAPIGSGLPEPRIGIDPASTGVTLSDNIMSAYYTAPGSGADWSVENNLLVQQDSPGQPGYYGDVFVNAMSGTGALENLQLLPGSEAAASGAGAPSLWYDAAPAALTALVRPETGPWLNEVLFDARLSAGPGGAAAAMPGARFSWEFGDGATGEGLVVSHRYAGAGEFTAVLTVTLPDGSSDTARAVTRIAGSDLLALDAERGSFAVTRYGETLEMAVDAAMLVRSAPAMAAEAAVTQEPLSAGTGAEDPAAALRFAADSMVVLPDDLVPALEGATSMTLTARLKAGAAGDVANLLTAFDLDITSAGELRATLLGTKVTTSGADLLDGSWHDLALRFDGSAGGTGLVLEVDGIVRAAIPLEGAINSDIRYDLKLGAQKVGATGFTGELAAFDIDADPAGYADPGAALATTVLLAGPATVPAAVAHMETGSVTMAQAAPGDWFHVSFEAPIEDARVVLGPLSREGRDPAVLRVQNVTETGFDVKIAEWGYLDGSHAAETFSWVAGSEGSYLMADGRQIAFGQSVLSGSSAGQVALSGAADMAVFAQVSSCNGAETVTTRLSQLDADGFSLRMQEEEASGGTHLAETVDWIAVTPGARTAIVEADHRGSHAALADSFVFLAGMQTENGADTAALRYLRDDAGISVYVEEESSADAELVHIAETVALAAFDAGPQDLYDL